MTGLSSRVFVVLVLVFVIFVVVVVVIIKEQTQQSLDWDRLGHASADWSLTARHTGDAWF